MSKYCSIFVALLCIVAYVSADCYSPIETPQKRENTYCEWYNDNSCCDQETAERVAGFPVTGCTIEESCQDQLTLASCGFYCSPNSGEYCNPLTYELRICKSFAEKVYSSCKSSEVKTSDRSCKTIEDQYDEAAFLALFGWTVVDGSENCLNGASLLNPTLLATIVALLALIAKF